jgi:hypothetical protein
MGDGKEGGREKARKWDGERIPCANNFNVVRNLLEQSGLEEVLFVLLSLFQVPKEVQQLLYSWISA